jgi:predicted permease
MLSVRNVLLIVDVLFLIDGLWAVIFGKLPTGLFNFLFGLGEYKFPQDKTRLFGLLLSSPLPTYFLASLILTNLLGEKGAEYAIIFGVIYILIIITASIIIVRKAKPFKTKKKR